MNILIQYEGFIVAGASRTYNFRVMCVPGEERRFTVHVLLGSFRPTRLKFQDGPNICFARLKKELADETEDSHANPRLNIGEQDIQSYLELQYPRKVKTSKFLVPQPRPSLA